MQITIGTIPRAFEGLHKIKQENAIRSWLQLQPTPKIILLSDDKLVDHAAQKFGCQQIVINRHPKLGGRPQMDSAFRKLQELAQTDVIGFINTDIILVSGVIKTIEQVVEKFEQFLIIGQRHNINIDYSLNFSTGWKKNLHHKVDNDDTLHGPSGIDYFFFPRGTIPELPPFLVGCPGWDNWIIQQLLILDIPIIDATENITCIHQDEGRGWPNDGTRYNRKLAGNNGNGGHISDSQWVIHGKKLRRR